VAGWKADVAAELAGEMALVDETGGRCDLGQRLAGCDPALGPVDPNLHPELLAEIGDAP
jgi:hypothetical protein